MRASHTVNAAIAFTLLLASVSVVYGFDVDGFHTGMTREELVNVARQRGLEAKELTSSSWGVGTSDDNYTDSNFNFCGDGLIAYSRSIDFDIDFVRSLHTLTESNGQPQEILTKEYPWSGPGGGNIHGVEIIWRHDSEKIEIAFLPEGRDDHGKIRNTRAASISYTTKNTCWKKF
jgi:hypothetical protein